MDWLGFYVSDVNMFLDLEVATTPSPGADLPAAAVAKASSPLLSPRARAKPKMVSKQQFEKLVKQS